MDVTLSLQTSFLCEHRCLPESGSTMHPYLCPMEEKETCFSFQQGWSKSLFASHWYKLVQECPFLTPSTVREIILSFSYDSFGLKWVLESYHTLIASFAPLVLTLFFYNEVYNLQSVNNTFWLLLMISSHCIIHVTIRNKIQNVYIFPGCSLMYSELFPPKKGRIC